MKCQILFSGKNKKNISKCRLLKILPRVLSVKAVVFILCELVATQCGAFIFVFCPVCCGVVGWCESTVYVTSPRCPTDIGLQLDKACYPCRR